MEPEKIKKLEELEQRLIQSAAKISKLADKILLAYNEDKIKQLNTSQLVQAGYELGKWMGSIDEGRKVYGDLPDYEKTIARLNILKSKLYQEAERKDRGF